MFNRKRFARNVAFNWGAYVASVAAGFFLAPYVVHNLGDGQYGYWSMAVTAVAWFGYLDLGLQSAVGHYVTRHLAAGDPARVEEKVNSALSVMLIIGAATAWGTALLAVFFSSFFHIPEGASGAVRAALVILGFTAAARFPLSVFQAMLVGAQRFDLVSGASIACKLLNAALVWFAFERFGKNLLSFAAVVSLTQILEAAALVWLARRVLPDIRPRLFAFRPAAFREMFDYGAFNFIINIATQVGTGIWAFILGRKAGAEAVTYFSIGSEVLPYMAGVASALTLPILQIVIPLDVVEAMESIRTMYLTGTRYFLALICVMGNNLLLVGGAFIAQWMGPQYLNPVHNGGAGSAGTVLAILTLANMAALSSQVAQQILFGRRRNKLFAAFIAAESLGIFLLALFLVPKHGIVGMAVATMIPLVLVEGLLIPARAARISGAGFGEYLLKAILPNAAVAGGVYLLGRAFLPYVPYQGWLHVFLSFALITAIHSAAAFALLVEGGHRTRLLHVIRERLAPAWKAAG